jgi:hypothetical protein
LSEKEGKFKIATNVVKMTSLCRARVNSVKGMCMWTGKRISIVAGYTVKEAFDM